MTYSIEIKECCIKTHRELKKLGFEGYSLYNKLKNIFKCFKLSIQKWIYKLNNYTFFNKNNKTTKYTKEHENFIVDLDTNNKTIKCKKIKKELSIKFNLSLSKTTIYKILKNNNLTYKQTIKKINP